MNYIKSLYLVVLLSLVSCMDANDPDAPVVSVGDDCVLTRADLLRAIPVAANREDSAVYADEYVRNWVRRKVILRKAEQNLGQELDEIEKSVNEYRTSLLVETYQQKLVEQKFNPKVSRGEIESYYSEMKPNFMLKEHIIKGIYAIIPQDASDISQFVKLLASFTDESSINIEQYLYKYSSNYKLSVDNWIGINSIRNIFPSGAIPDDLKTLRSTKLFDVSYEGQRYLLKITDIRQASTIAPIEYVSRDIYNILLSKKKLEFISSLADGLFDEAVSDGIIKYYDKND